MSHADREWSFDSRRHGIHIRWWHGTKISPDTALLTSRPLNRPDDDLTLAQRLLPGRSPFDLIHHPIFRIKAKHLYLNRDVFSRDRMGLFRDSVGLCHERNGSFHMFHDQKGLFRIRGVIRRKAY